MKKEIFNLKAELSIQELEERHELSILAPAELAEDSRCDRRCSGNDVDVELSAASIG